MHIIHRPEYVTLPEAANITKYSLNSIERFVRKGSFGNEDDGGITFYEGQILVARDRLFPRKREYPKRVIPPLLPDEINIDSVLPIDKSYTGFSNIYIYKLNKQGRVRIFRTSSGKRVIPIEDIPQRVKPEKTINLIKG